MGFPRPSPEKKKNKNRKNYNNKIVRILHYVKRIIQQYIGKQKNGNGCVVDRILYHGIGLLAKDGWVG